MMRGFRSKVLLQAQALMGGSRRDPTTEEIGRARRMAAQGCTCEEIRREVWPYLSAGSHSTRDRLHRLGIFCDARKKAHRGRDVHMPAAGVDTRSFRPRGAE